MAHVELADFLSTLPGGTEPVPRSVIDYPGMTANDEKALLYHLGRGHYRGDGVIVDAGLFLGASTNAFAAGIIDNPAAHDAIVKTGLRPLTSYEVALWHDEGFNKYLERPEVKAIWRDEWSFTNGDNYMPVLEALLEPYRDLIEFRIGDILETAREDRPVEIAFYDCLKNRDRDAACFNAFAPHYIAGHTVVIQQDYFYEDALYNKIRQEFLSPYFRFLGGVATSAVFQLVEPIPAAYFEKDPIDDLSIDQCIDLLDAAAARIPLSAFHIYAALAPVRYATQTRHFNQAEVRLEEVERMVRRTPLPERAHQVTVAARDWLESRRHAVPG